MVNGVVNWQTKRTGSTPDVVDRERIKALERARRLPGVVRGFLVGIANPKDLLFFVAFFPQFVGITPDSRVSLAILAALWIAVDFTILTGYMAAINHPLLHRKQRWITASSAGALLVIALAGLGGAMAGSA